MPKFQKLFAAASFALFAAAALWVVSTPVEADAALPAGEEIVALSQVSDLVVFETCPTDGVETNAKPIKDPNCKKPCKPAVRLQTGIVCVFVGCFEETGECAYRC